MKNLKKMVLRLIDGEEKTVDIMQNKNAKFHISEF